MKTHPVFLSLLLVSTAAFGLDQVYLEPVTPVSTILKGQGGTSTSTAQGYDALFHNPAAFADSKATITFLDLEATANMPLSGINRLLDARASWGNINLLATDNPMRTILNDLITQSGVGAETSIGFGWVGRNLGLGLVNQTRLMAKGSSLLETKTTVDETLMGVIGMAWPFDIGFGTLQVGGAIRPMQKTLAELTSNDLLTHGMDVTAYQVNSGFGLGLDLGARWLYGDWTVGLAVRDASGTVFNFQGYSLAKWIGGLGFPSGGSTDGTTLYRIPTVIGLGGTWKPNLGALSSLLQPSLSADFQIPIKDQYTQPSFWTWTHLGGEVTLLKFYSIRMGINQGYPTFGLGFHLFVVDFNMAIYADELGRYSGLNRRSGVSLDLAFRL